MFDMDKNLGVFVCNVQMKVSCAQIEMDRLLTKLHTLLARTETLLHNSNGHDKQEDDKNKLCIWGISNGLKSWTVITTEHPVDKIC